MITWTPVCGPLPVRKRVIVRPEAWMILNEIVVGVLACTGSAGRKSARWIVLIGVIATELLADPDPQPASTEARAASRRPPTSGWRLITSVLSGTDTTCAE